MDDQPSTIYHGTRGEPFKKLIINLLERGNLHKDYINDLTSSETTMKMYSQAFTATSGDEDNNYQIFEQLGDLSANKFIVSYVYKRFPQIECPKGLKIAARLRINLGAKDSFYVLAEELNFWEYLTASEEDRMRNKKPLLEDTFEAFIGCTEQILDNLYRPGVGYGVVYAILESIFEKKYISLDYDDLFDAKTKLKETFDYFKDLGAIIYISNRDTDGTLSVSSVYMVPTKIIPEDAYINYKKGQINYKYHGLQPLTRSTMIDGEAVQIKSPRPNWQLLGTGKAALKKDSDQKAAEQGYKAIRQKGWIKPLKDEYLMFCNKPTSPKK